MGQSVVSHLNLKAVDFDFKSFSVLPCKLDGENVETCSREQAEFWGIYITRMDNTKYWLIDFRNSISALKFIKFLLSVVDHYKPHGK